MFTDSTRNHTGRLWRGSQCSVVRSVTERNEGMGPANVFSRSADSPTGTPVPNSTCLYAWCCDELLTHEYAFGQHLAQLRPIAGIDFPVSR